MVREQKQKDCGQALLNGPDPLKFVSPPPPPFKPSLLTSAENKRRGGKHGGGREGDGKTRRENPKIKGNPSGTLPS